MAAPAPALSVSVVVVTYNRLGFLPATLAALENLRYRAFELVIVNGPSTDGTGDYLRQHWATRAKLVSCPDTNVSQARNLGIAAAAGDIVCFTDDDGVPEPDWLDRLLEAYADPDVAAVGGYVRDHSGVNFQTRAVVSRRDSTSDAVARFATLPACRPFADEFPALIGVNSSYRRSALMAIGGFDEAYRYYLEETDLVLRLIDAGHRVVMQPDAEVHHKYAPSDMRDADRVPTRWNSVMTSTAYYIMHNALPGTALADRLQLIDERRAELEATSRDLFARGKIGADARDRLIADLAPGMRAGIALAFANPGRRLARRTPPRAWQPLARRHDGIDRLRLAFVCRSAADDDGTNAALRTSAAALAAIGHEVTVIQPATMSRHASVDFDRGLWIHQLVDDDAGREWGPATRLGLPDMPPRRRRHALAVLDELIRVAARRRFEFVIGNGWEMAAVVASRAFVSVVGLQPSAPAWRGLPGLDWLALHATHDLRDAPGQRTVDGLAWLLGSLRAPASAHRRSPIDATGTASTDDRDAA